MGRNSYSIILFTELVLWYRPLYRDISFDYILIDRLLYIRVLSRSQNVYTNPSLGLNFYVCLNYFIKTFNYMETSSQNVWFKLN
ncbi:hypothetical protein YC2023_020026 [Brassica napus]